LVGMVKKPEGDVVRIGEEDSSENDDDSSAIKVEGGLAIFNDESTFEEWIGAKIRELPAYAYYPQLLESCILIVLRWRSRFSTAAKKMWSRIISKNRLVKELNEIVPVIHECLSVADKVILAPGQTMSVVDLCSGYGFLSMFLSELLPKEKFSRIVLIDKMFPRFDQRFPPSPQQINWEHIWLDSWPIRLQASRQDLKQGCDRRHLGKRFLSDTGGPVLLLGVHLCGILSLRALDLFNTYGQVVLLCLKPCCLPPMVHVKKKETFVVGGYSFPAEDVCSPGKWKGNNWTGLLDH